jgi:hypothetical protein
MVLLMPAGLQRTAAAGLRLADGPAVEACRLQRAGGVEDVLRGGLAGVDEAGGGVGLQAEGLAGQVGQVTVGKSLPSGTARDPPETTMSGAIFCPYRSAVRLATPISWPPRTSRH